MNKPKFDPNAPFDVVEVPKIEESSQPSGAIGPAGAAIPTMEGLKGLGVAAAGALKGGTLGFSDEMMGALAAKNELGSQMVNAISPNKEFESQKILDAYRSMRDATRGAEKNIQESNPEAYIAGELGGAFLTPVPMGKARAVGMLGKAAQYGIEGAALGGGVGLGSSEADLTKGEFEQAGADTLSGAKMGGELGIAVPAGLSVAKGAANLGKKLVNTAGEIDMINTMKNLAKSGYEKEAVFGKKNREALSKLSDETISKYTDDILNLRQNINKDINNILNGETTVGNASLVNNLAKIEKMKQSKGISKDDLNALNELGDQVKSHLNIKSDMNVIPGQTDVIPGATIPSGEEKAFEKIQMKKAGQEVKDMGAEPTAIQKLRDRFAKKNIMSEEPSSVDFSPEKVLDQSTGREGFKVIDPSKNIDAELVNSLQPGEVQKFKQGDFEFFGYKNANGKVEIQPISSEPGYSKVGFEKQPDIEAPFETMPEKQLIPQELENFRKNINESAKAAKYETAPLYKQATTGLSKDISQSMNELPGYREAMDKSGSLQETVQYGLGKEKARVGDIAKTEFKTDDFKQEIGELVRKYNKNNIGGRDAQMRIDKMFERLQEADPVVAAEYQNQFKELSRKFGLSENLKGSDSGLVQVFNLPWMLKAGAYGTGRATRAIFDKTPQELKTLANVMISSGSKAKAQAGQVLQKIADAPSEQARAALIYSYSQNPAYRQALEDQDYSE